MWALTGCCWGDAVYHAFECHCCFNSGHWYFSGQYYVPVVGSEPPAQYRMVTLQHSTVQHSTAHGSCTVLQSKTAPHCTGSKPLWCNRLGGKAGSAQCKHAAHSDRGSSFSCARCRISSTSGVVGFAGAWPDLHLSIGAASGSACNREQVCH